MNLPNSGDFCLNCGNIVDLPIYSDLIECLFCNHKTKAIGKSIAYKSKIINKILPSQGKIIKMISNHGWINIKKCLNYKKEKLWSKNKNLKKLCKFNYVIFRIN